MKIPKRVVIWHILWRLIVLYSLLLVVFRIGVIGLPRMHSASDFILYLLCLTEDYTCYATKYSESAFMSLQKGMGKKEIIQVLGEPLDHWEIDQNREVWAYTAPSQQDAFYWKRRLYFDKEQTLYSIAYGYWDD